jgi:hypothetical protein
MMSAINDELDSIIFELTKITSDLKELNKALDNQDRIIKARDVADIRLYNITKLFDNGS